MENLESKGVELETPQQTKEREISLNKEKTSSEIEKLGTKFLSEKANDPDIKKATEKILGKELEGKTINKLGIINQEVFVNKKISEYTKEIVKKNPELRSFMIQLGIGGFVEKKYEQLLPTQKIILLALEDALHGKTLNLVKIDTYTENNGKIDLVKFQNAYLGKMNNILGYLQDGVTITQASNLGRIKKTLKEEYKLTEVETTKYIAYLEIIKNQPKAHQEAGAMGLAVYGGLMLVVGALLGIGVYKFFTGKSASETVISGRMELGTPEFVSQLTATEIYFNATGVVEKAQFKEDIEGNEIVNMFKKAINVAQTRKVVMEVNGKVGIEYDLMKAEMSYDPDTRTLYARLRSPQARIKDSSSKIIDDNTQIWQTKDFVNLPIQLQDSLANDARKKIENNPQIMQQAERNVAKVLGDIYGWGLGSANYTIENVVIELTDPSGKVVSTKKYDDLNMRPYAEPSQRPLKIN